MDASISAAELRKSLSGRSPPLVIDVRRNERFLEAKDLIRGAVRRDPAQVAEWSKTLPRAASVVVYCVHGHEVSQNAAKALGARFLEGGIEHWREEGGELAGKPTNAATRWVTRERPKIDRIACPWLVRRFIDPGAEFLYVPAAEVKRIAEKEAATPYDVADVEFTHVGERCSFDAFLDKFHLKDPALDALATIVRGADTSRLDLAPQSPGLLAISQGLSMNFPDDHHMLEHGMVLYDALYAWCRSHP
jgi:rhodanese-related sulfurtransferase